MVFTWACIISYYNLISRCIFPSENINSQFYKHMFQIICVLTHTIVQHAKTGQLFLVRIHTKTCTLMRTFFTNLRKLPLLLTLISPRLISYTNSDAVAKNKSVTKGYGEIVQAFKSYGDIRTSHDSKNRCVTWLLLELWDSISQSINMRMHTHMHTVRTIVMVSLSSCLK